MIAFLRLFLKFYLALNSYIFNKKKSAVIFNSSVTNHAKIARIVKDTIS